MKLTDNELLYYRSYFNRHCSKCMYASLLCHTSCEGLLLLIIIDRLNKKNIREEILKNEKI